MIDPSDPRWPMAVDPGPGIPREFRQILAELELLSHGKTQTWNKTAHGTDRDPKPQGESRPPHLEYRDRYERARDDLGRDHVRSEARKTLNEWKGTTATKTKQAKQEPAHLRRQEILKKGEGWDASDVARVYRTSVREIIDIRKDAARDPSTGRVPPAEEDATDQARRLKDNGLNVRQIAAYQGVEPSTVSRRLKKAA